jgi:ElaB/YqjD/DUF883 family membrane-anchored ribosome-binding protein
MKTYKDIDQTWIGIDGVDLEKIQIEVEMRLATENKQDENIENNNDDQSKSFRDECENENKENGMTSTQFNGQMDPNKMKTKVQHLIEDDIVEPAQQYLSKARDFSSRALDRGTDVVKENPGYSMLGAAAIGFLAGAYIARKK